MSTVRVKFSKVERESIKEWVCGLLLTSPGVEKFTHRDLPEKLLEYKRKNNLQDFSYVLHAFCFINLTHFKLDDLFENFEDSLENMYLSMLFQSWCREYGTFSYDPATKLYSKI